MLWLQRPSLSCQHCHMLAQEVSSLSRRTLSVLVDTRVFLSPCCFATASREHEPRVCSGAHPPERDDLTCGPISFRLVIIDPPCPLSHGTAIGNDVQSAGVTASQTLWIQQLITGTAATAH